jgi:SAM-dependent methyltransferase
LKNYKNLLSLEELDMGDFYRYIVLGIVIIAIIFVFSIVWSNIKGAPWFPTRMDKVKKMLNLAAIQPGEVVYDLGCGDGRFIITAARKFGAKAVGIEVDFFLFLWCQFLITVLGLRKKIKVIYGDLFKKDLSNADVVVCFLWPSTNKKLQEKLIKELKSTARVISNKFTFDDLLLVAEDSEEKIYVYHLR